MKIIILAAGMGSRLEPLTDNTPKPLMDLGNGKTLLETQLQNIKDSGVIDEVILVVGYCGEQIEAKIRKYQQEGMKIRTVFNPFFDVSNNLMTLWMAKHEMNEDFIITNGDNIFEKDVFQGLVNNKNGIFLTISKKEKYYEDDMKVILSEAGAEKILKTIPCEEAHAESVGLSLCSGERSINAFKNMLEEMGRGKQNHNLFWLDVFNNLIQRGVNILPFEINGAEKWKEVDLHMDLQDLIRFKNEFLSKYAIKQEREKQKLLTENKEEVDNPEKQLEY